MSELTNPSACCLLLFLFCSQLWCFCQMCLLVLVLGVPLHVANFFNKSATAETFCLHLQSSDL